MRTASPTSRGVAVPPMSRVFACPFARTAPTAFSMRSAAAPGEPESGPRHRAEHLEGLCHHLGGDAVFADHGQPVLAHGAPHDMLAADRGE